jgi:hypothetical protein
MTREQEIPFDKLNRLDDHWSARVSRMFAGDGDEGDRTIARFIPANVDIALRCFVSDASQEVV